MVITFTSVEVCGVLYTIETDVVFHNEMNVTSAVVFHGVVRVDVVYVIDCHMHRNVAVKVVVDVVILQ